MDLGPEEVILAVTEVKDGPSQKVGSEEGEEDFPIEEDSREENLTKALPLRDSEYLVRLKTKTKTDTIIVISEDILQPNALREIRVNLKSLLRGRSLKTIHMLMEVQKNPN